MTGGHHRLTGAWDHVGEGCKLSAGSSSLRSGMLRRRFVTAVTAAMVGAAVSATGAEATTVSVPVTADCSLYMDTPNASSCTDTTLNVGRYPAVSGKAIHSLLRFDVAAQVPPGQHIESATLNLKFVDAHESESFLAVHRLTSSFGAAATWNTRDGSTAWTTPGGDFDAADDETYTQTWYAPDWVQWDVTKMVAAWASGRAPNHGLALVSTQPSVLDAVFAASEDGPSTAPFIEVTYKPNTGINPAFAGHSIPLADGSTLNVDLGTGNLTLAAQDMYEENPRQDVDLGRYYNSLDAETGQLGPAWRLSTGRDIRLVECGKRANRCLLGPSGVRGVFLRNDDGSYTAPPELAGTLVQNSGGTFTLALGGATYNFGTGADPTLLSVGTTGNNAITLTYGGLGGRLSQIEDEDGHTLTVATNVVGAIDEIEETGLGTLTYGYTSGRLTSATTPAGTTTYGYDGSGRLSAIDDGAEDWTISYDGASRVSQITHNDGSGARTITFAYASPSSPCTGGDLVKSSVTYGSATPTVTCVRPDLGVSYRDLTDPGLEPARVEDDDPEPSGSNDDSADDPDGTCEPDEELGDYDWCEPSTFSTLDASGPGLNPALAPGGSGWGVSEPRVEMFNHPGFADINPRHVRIIVAWDDALLGERAKEDSPDPNVVDDYKQLKYIKDYVAEADRTGRDVTISLQMSRKREQGSPSTSPTYKTEYDAFHTLPTVNQYRAAFDAFLRNFPTVNEFTPWNEPNHGQQPTSYTSRRQEGEPENDGPKYAAQYYKQMKSVCKKRARACLVLAGDFVDSFALNESDDDINNGFSYYRAYITALKTKAPYWAIHPYKIENYDPSAKPRNKEPFRKFMDRTQAHSPDSRVWITEFGQHSLDPVGDDRSDLGSGVRRKRGFRHMLADLDYSDRVERFYYYRMFDFNVSNNRVDKWGTGLFNWGGAGTYTPPPPPALEPADAGTNVQPKCLYFIYRYVTNPAAGTTGKPAYCPSGYALTATP